MPLPYNSAIIPMCMVTVKEVSVFSVLECHRDSQGTFIVWHFIAVTDKPPGNLLVDDITGYHASLLRARRQPSRLPYNSGLSVLCMVTAKGRFSVGIFILMILFQLADLVQPGYDPRRPGRAVRAAEDRSGRSFSRSRQLLVWLFESPLPSLPGIIEEDFFR